MGRAEATKQEVGRLLVLYLADGEDVISGTLARVTDYDLYLEVYDALGNDTGVRHVIPWTSVHRFVSFDPDNMPVFEEDEDLPEPPAWVSEVLMAAAAAGIGDDGTV